MTLRSALSWTRWRQSRTEKRRQEMRLLLMQLAVPLAQALQRQDQLLQLTQEHQLLRLTDQLLLLQHQMQSLESLLLESLSPRPGQVESELLSLARSSPSSAT